MSTQPVLRWTVSRDPAGGWYGRLVLPGCFGIQTHGDTRQEAARAMFRAGGDIALTELASENPALGKALEPILAKRAASRGLSVGEALKHPLMMQAALLAQIPGLEKVVPGIARAAWDGAKKYAPPGVKEAMVAADLAVDLAEKTGIPKALGKVAKGVVKGASKAIKSVFKAIF